MQFREQLRRPFVELVDVRILQGVLILRARGAAADVEVLRRLQEQRRTGHLRQLRPQPVDDLIGGGAALVARFEADHDEAVVDGPAAAEAGAVARDVRIAGDHVEQRVLAANHLVEGDILRRIGQSGDDAGVLLRKESLGYLDVQQHGRRDRDQEYRQGGALVIEHEIETARVPGKQAIEGALDRHVGLAVLRVLLVAQEQGAHGRRERQRHEGRDDDGHRHGDREFAEQAADDAAHQQQRNEYGDQRDADGHDGEADLARALERRLQRRQTGLDVPVDVLQHHDGIIDHETDGDGQRHQRQVVQAVIAARTSSRRCRAARAAR